MSHDSDGVHEFMQGQLRTAVLVACQVGEALARARERALRESEGVDREHAQALRERLAGERAADAALLRSGATPGWADSAPAEQVVEAVQATAKWQGQDPEAGAARRELWQWAKDQGVDLEVMQSDIDRARAALQERVDGLRASAAERTDEGATLVAMAADDLQEALERGGTASAYGAAHEGDAQTEYDSAERREALAARLQSAGVPDEAVDAVVVADRSQALPATEAVATVTRKGTKARRARGRGQRGAEQGRGR